MKRLSVFLDGTWNDEGSKTNVWRLSQLVADRGRDGAIQAESHYEEGVGTEDGEKFRGGTLGFGLSRIVQKAYKYLMERYEEGDDVYIFGFSRGAYTARSLGGLIAGCGLARKGGPLTLEYLYDRYQHRKTNATPIWELDFIHKSRHPSRRLTVEEAQLLEHSRRIPIKMMGVWDTVGALGVPWTGMPIIGRDKFYFHNPNLSKIYENAFQALALDEHRGAYKPTLWTLFVPETDDGRAPPPPTMPSRDNVEQRWFIGAHANVGGGYDPDTLNLPPLRWLQEKADALGLTFTKRVSTGANDYQTAPVDSYARFVKHLYQILTLNRRYYRPIGAPARKVNKGWSFPVNESIDATVLQRFHWASAYRPKNLVEWASRKGLNLATTQGDQIV